MKESIDPSKISKNVEDGQLNQKDAFKILETIISESESETKRIEAIQAIGSLSLLKEHVYKILEKCMISDESPLARVESAKVILNLFGARDSAPILWAIKNEKSVFFFKHLLDFLESNTQANLPHIRNQVIEKLIKIYDLEYNDLKFMIDLDYLDALKFLNQYQEFTNKFDVKKDHQRELFLQNTTLNKKGLSRINKIIDRHIVDLELHDLDEIPDSINHLPKLEFLKIDHCNFKGKNLENIKLSHLKKLTFTNNQMDELPNWILKITTNSDEKDK